MIKGSVWLGGYLFIQIRSANDASTVFNSDDHGLTYLCETMKIATIIKTVAGISLTQYWQSSSSSCGGLPDFLKVTSDGGCAQTNCSLIGTLGWNTISCNYTSQTTVASVSSAIYGTKPYYAVEFYSDAKCSSFIKGTVYRANECISRTDSSFSFNNTLNPSGSLTIMSYTSGSCPSTSFQTSTTAYTSGMSLSSCSDITSIFPLSGYPATYGRYYSSAFANGNYTLTSAALGPALRKGELFIAVAFAVLLLPY